MKFSYSQVLLFCLAFFLYNPKVIAQETDHQVEQFCHQELSQKIDDIIEENAEGSRWGVMIQDSLDQSVLYRRNANQFFILASNLKLFTTALALSQFPPDFQIKTPIFTQGQPPNLEQLRIIGKGDPSFNSYHLEQLAEQLSNQGVRSIATLMLETGYFDTPAINSTWEWEDVYAAYGTAVNSLILDENAVTLTLRPQQVGEAVQADWDNDIAASQWTLTGEAITAPKNTDYAVELNRELGTSQLNLSGTLPRDIQRDVWQLAIPNPDYYFRDVLLTKLREKGIQVNQVQFSASEVSPISGELIMQFVSPPLEELIVEINRNSNNLYAEALLKILIEEVGEDVIQEQLMQLGVLPDGYSLADGSGLSRRNLATPSAIAQLLQGMLNHQNADTFQSSLALAGVNGTLENRFQGTPLQGKIQGKTGTLTGISALSGYVNSPQDQPLIFSILLNHSQRPPSEQRKMIDQIILLLSQLKDC
ncbi:MAG: D-alanyl-D-alanine carboxypeptidase/D-alanyl-D-alanine-endopeptidase [Halothece sp. Uz-M2-17]|nr:D-alanyl-D-alanine carboxypeptidase/D-alanyl-D-alanine-endopeptidase [Halothece sp. Uz-M2-17]